MIPTERPHLYRARYNVQPRYGPAYSQAVDVWAWTAEEAVYLADRRIGRYGSWTHVEAIKPWLSLRALTEAA